MDKIYRNIIPKEIVESINETLPLTVFQANKKSKKCKIYKFSSVKISYSYAATTLGRKILRDLCGLKSFSDIVYN